MPKVSPLQGNFNGGEFSPYLYGRVDADRYKAGLALCKNWLPTIQGGLTRRPGTKFVASVKTPSKKTRLQAFEFSVTQAYMLEFGDQYIRFFKDNAQITNASTAITGATQANPVVITSNAHGLSNGDRVVITGVLGMTQLNNREFTVAGATANTFELSGINGTGFSAYTSGGSVAKIYEISSPYLEADLFQLKFTQSADVLYITHPSYQPRKLTRTGHTSWTLSTITFIDGPYLGTNNTGTGTSTATISASSASGATVLTASSALFTANDVGRLVRLLLGGVWGYVKIDSFTSTTVVNATVQGPNLGGTGATGSWRLGVWSDLMGWPSCVTFHEDRLFFGGANAYPQRLDGSNSSDYENFKPTDVDGTVKASNAVAFSFNANDVNVVRWLISDEKGLIAGTVGGEWIVRPSSQSEALSPTNITAKRSTSYGSANIQPVQVGKAAVFVQRAGRKVRDISYYYDVDGFRAPNLTELAEHITSPGLVQLAHQKEPQSFMWGVRSDGVVTAMTYERDLDSLRVGWSRQVLGGYSDAANTDAVVESAAVIPSTDGSRSEVWFVVKRYINGATVRYIDYLTRLFEDEVEQKDAFFVDSGLTYDDPKTITNITAANPPVVTSNGHGFSNGDQVLITEVKGLLDDPDPEEGESLVNTNSYTVANVTANTFELSGANGAGFTAYISGGKARKYVSTISSLNHLEGQSVQICGDGAAQPNRTVTNGVITLQTAATTVHIGLGYKSDAQMLRIEAGAADGTALGKTRRTHRAGWLLHRTLGLKIGTDFDRLDNMIFRETSDSLTRAVPLFSGIKSQLLESDYDFENLIAWRQDQPLPATILAVMPQMVVQDR